MIELASTLAIVPARAGSKRLPGKNLRLLGGKPMIAWTLEAALASKSINAVCVTSDDEDVLALARSMGVQHIVHRPVELASDTATSEDVVLHALDACGAHSRLCLLQPTSPLRMIEDIDGALALQQRVVRPVVSVCETTHPLAWCVGLDADDSLQAIDAPLPTPAFEFNGAIYVIDIDAFRNNPCFTPSGTRAFRMPRNRSIDVDTLFDFRVCEALLAGSASD